MNQLQVITIVISAWLSTGACFALENANNNQELWLPDIEQSGALSKVAAKLQSRKLWGFVDKTGKFVIKPQYSQVQQFHDGIALVQQDTQYFKIDKLGNKITPPLAFAQVNASLQAEDEAKNAAERLENEKQTYKGDIFDATGTKILAHIQDVTLWPFSEGLAACGFHNKENKVGFIDLQGRTVIEPAFQFLGNFQNGIAVVGQIVDEKEGFIDKTGHLIGGHCFKYAWNFENGFGIVCKQKSAPLFEEWGFIDKDGKELMGDYIRVDHFSAGLAPVQTRSGLWGFIDTQGNMVIPPQFEWASSFSDNLAIVKTESGYGLIDLLGHFVLPPKLADLDQFKEGLAPAAEELPEAEKLKILANNIEWHCGFIDENGKGRIAPRFTSARHFSEGLAAVQDGLRWGYISKDGAWTITPQFESAMPFAEGLAAVQFRDKWGFIDKTGAFVIKPSFPAHDWDGDSIAPPQKFSEGVTVVCGIDLKPCYVDRKGESAFSVPWAIGAANFKEAHPFKEGLAAYPGKNYTKYGYLNHAGKFSIKPAFDKVRPFSAGLAGVEVTSAHDKAGLQTKWGFINKQGILIAPPQFDEVGSFNESLAPVAKGAYINPERGPTPKIYISKNPFGQELKAKWGFVDEKARIVIPSKFDGALDFSEGRAAVQVGNKWGFIDHGGHIVVEPKFDQANSFCDGRALVKIDNKFGYIDRKGSLVIPTKFFLCGSFSEGRALVVCPSNKQATASTSPTWTTPMRTQDDMTKLFELMPPPWFTWAGHN